jgi:hypothetical protein
LVPHNGKLVEAMSATKSVPRHLHAAYDWTHAAGELAELAQLRGRKLATYARESAANARDHDMTDVHASDIKDLAAWLRQQSDVLGQTKHSHATKKSPAQLDREIAEALGAARSHHLSKRWQIGDKVLYQGKPYIIVREATPLDFWVKVRDKEPTHGTVSIRAYDLMAGDDPDSWDAEFQPRIQADALRVR